MGEIWGKYCWASSLRPNLWCQDLCKPSAESWLFAEVQPRLVSWAMAPQRAAALVAEASLVVTTPRAVAALKLVAIRAVARPFRARATDRKTTETQRHRELKSKAYDEERDF